MDNLNINEMKKTFLMVAAMMVSVLMQAASFGILVNGKMYYAGTENPTPGDPSFREFMVLGLPLNAGDYCQLSDAGSNYASWVVDLDKASVSAISRDDDKYAISASGCYDFYIKIKNQQDQLYVGTGDCGSPLGVDITGGQGGQGGGSELAGNPRFMWKAELDGDWKEPSKSTMFVDGHTTISFYESAYLFLIYQVDGSAGVEYMCEAYTSDTHARFIKGGVEKWGVPVGTTDLYIYDNGDGSVEVSNQPMPGKTIWSPNGAQGVENIHASEKAHKVIIDGQLRIVRGDKLYDATGRILAE